MPKTVKIRVSSHEAYDPRVMPFPRRNEISATTRAKRSATIATPRAAGLIIESGLADPLERILVRIEPSEVGATAEELRASVQRCFDQRAKMAAFTGRVLVMHTRNDDLVSVSHAERLHAWANGPKQLLVFERGDHNTILSANLEPYFAAVGAFIQSIRESAAHGDGR